MTSNAIKISANDFKREKDADIIKLFNNNTPKTKAKIRGGIPHRTECLKSLDDINKIRNYFVSNRRYRDDMMFVVGICTGLRISDLCSLNVGDVVTSDGTFKDYIDIVEKKTGKHSANSEDKCYITEAMRIAIARYLNSKKKWSVKDPLLYSKKTNKNGEHRIAEESGWRIMKQAQRECGIKYNLGSHSMRKTFANIAACCGGRSNVDMNKLLQVQHMLKHSDYKTTMRYLNLNSIFTSKARQDVSDFVLGKTKYNDLSEALMNNDDADKISKIYDMISQMVETRTGDM